MPNVSFRPDGRVENLGSPEEQEKMARKIQAALKSEEIKAKYKVELQFGKNRSISTLKPSVGVMLIWESGKRFHGGGDQQMYWCGFDDCQFPMSTDNFGFYHVVCPTCNRENFLDKPSKDDHILEARRMGKNTASFKGMPIVFGERYFNLTPPKIADLIEKVWRRLGCNADIYIKYHPSDIRYRAMFETAKTQDDLEKARRLRGLLIYPLARILKDTSTGAEARKQFLKLVTA
jgi:hypothetical protein